MAGLETLYQKLQLQGRSDQVEATLKWTIEERGWARTRHLIEPQLRLAIQELGFMYVPKTYGPGPAIVFPMVDVDGKTLLAQMKPMHDMFGPQKYHVFGDKEKHLGPGWIGATPTTIDRIVRTGVVGITEGPFDLVAAKCAAPSAPLISSRTKKLGRAHIQYLKMLGLEKLYVLFDQEVSEKGQEATDILARTCKKWFEVIPLRCPAHDPSDALKSVAKFKQLQALLEPLAISVSEETIVVDEDEE